MITKQYDGLNRRIKKYFKVSLDQFDVQYDYDLAGRPLDALFYKVAGTPGVAWTYDAAGRRITEATGGQSLGFTYDSDSNPSTLTWPDAESVTYAYDAADRFSSVSNSAFSVTAGYDTLSRVNAVTRAGGTSTAAISYDYADRMTRLAHVFTPTTGNETWTLGFTDAGQLSTSTSSNHAWDWQAVAASPVTTTPNGLNQNASVAGTSWTYDANGNLTSDGTRTFTYDPENRLLTESGPVSLALSYDPTGRLEQSVISGVTTGFLYDGDALVAEYDGSGNLLRRYVHGPGVDAPLVWFEGPTMTSAGANYLIADRQGSIAAVASSAGAVTANYTYDPYGAPGAWGVIGANPRFRYTGQIAIPEAQLYYYKARVYDPVAGKFLQTDPVGDKDDLNLYAYVEEDPVNLADPLGQAPWELYPRFEDAAMDASNEAVLASRAARQHNEFGTRIFKTPDGRFVYGPLVEGAPFRPDQRIESTINLWSSAGSLQIFLHTRILGSQEFATVHSHPDGNPPSSRDIQSDMSSQTIGVVGEAYNRAGVFVSKSAINPSGAAAGSGLSSGHYSLTQPSHQPGALLSVTVNTNGSVTGNYAPVTGTRIGASLTKCQGGGNC